MPFVVCGTLLDPLDQPVFVNAQEHCQVLRDVFSGDGDGDARNVNFPRFLRAFPRVWWWTLIVRVGSVAACQLFFQ